MGHQNGPHQRSAPNSARSVIFAEVWWLNAVSACGNAVWVGSKYEWLLHLVDTSKKCIPSSLLWCIVLARESSGLFLSLAHFYCSHMHLVTVAHTTSVGAWCRVIRSGSFSATVILYVGTFWPRALRYRPSACTSMGSKAYDSARAAVLARMTFLIPFTNEQTGMCLEDLFQCMVAWPASGFVHCCGTWWWFHRAAELWRIRCGMWPESPMMRPWYGCWSGFTPMLTSSACFLESCLYASGRFMAYTGLPFFIAALCLLIFFFLVFWCLSFLFLFCLWKLPLQLCVVLPSLVGERKIGSRKGCSTSLAGSRVHLSMEFRKNVGITSQSTEVTW